MGAIPASTLVICAVPDFVTWAVGHLSAVSDDPHQLCQAGRYFSSEKVKYKSLTRYVLLSVCISTVVNLLTISPLRNSDSFVTVGQWLTFKSIIALLILCGVVLAINLFFCASPSGTLFWAGFLQEIDLFFSSENALSTFCQAALASVIHIAGY